MSTPSFMIAAGSSGTGKTMITCGLLQILKKRGYRTVSFKCGPDYIDPMFHTRVLGTKSRNLDTFFTGENGTRDLFEKNSAGYDAAVLEGVMGYYDGLGGISTRASAYDVARVTDTGVILLVNCRGMSVSLAAQIRGFLDYRPDSRIRGVILNRISPMMYGRMKKLIEQELHIQVYGYVPELDDCLLESRHLGLVMPDEIPALREKIEQLGERLEETLDVDSLIKDFYIQKKPISSVEQEGAGDAVTMHQPQKAKKPTIRLGLAKDEAFCFFYEDNLTLLREMGAELIEFSPVHDEVLPEAIQGLLLYGGYPELYAGELSQNESMRRHIRTALGQGMPCMAECGGFLYLQESLEDMGGRVWPMAGYLKGKSHKTDRLSRFGYITLTGGRVFGKEAGPIPAHEFHYYDSGDCGASFTAQKPLSDRNWPCMHSTGHLLAGYPHLHYYGNPKVAEYFMDACRAYAKKEDIV